MNEKKNIDDLLNSFVDGELSARKHTEMKRIAEHDASISRRIQQIRTVRTLVGALPRADAPAGLSEQLRELLERKTPSNERMPLPATNERLRYALLRKAMSAAAMVGLVLVLSVVVYTIVVPPGDNLNSTPGSTTLATVHTGMEKMPIGGRLEFACDALSAVNMSVNRAIKINGLMDHTERQDSTDQHIYRVRCSQQALCLLLDEIRPIWPQFRASTLHLNTDRISAPLAVNAITASQTMEIFKQESLALSIDTARRVAVQNSTDTLSPSDTMLALSTQQLENAMTVSKPMLTSNSASPERDYSPADDEPLMDLTIALTLQK